MGVLYPKNVPEDVLRCLVEAQKHMLPNYELENDIWRFILGFYQDYGFSPLRREIARELKISEQLVQYHLWNLEKAGKIHFNPLKKRNILIGPMPFEEKIKIK